MTKHTPAVNNRIDPVCGTHIAPGPDPLAFIFDGHDYFFCAEACRKAFAQNPKKYLAPKRKSIWRRYLDRLNKTTGGKPPACCQ